MGNQYDFEEIGKRIRSERKKAGYKSATLFAQALLLGRSKVEKIEQGNVSWLPDYETLEKMSNLFDCEIDYIIGKSPCRTREVTDIAVATGISGAAAEKLKLNAGGYWKALSSVLENDTFWQFLKLMETYKLAERGDGQIGELVNWRVNAAINSLLPEAEQKDRDIFVGEFIQSICTRYCEQLLNDYKKEEEPQWQA